MRCVIVRIADTRAASPVPSARRQRRGVAGLSVAVALLIGAQELIALLAAKLGIAAVAVWRFGRLDQRWAPDRRGERVC
ncbi:hypothetical protein [Nocardia amamiensis]|uniref:hypothetical protein n=1 Tax=Nocardia amamiensis TaxID=404578 RepID=UPI00082CC30D|nr:hypothetical protein [Nocardia amamiensis]